MALILTLEEREILDRNGWNILYEVDEEKIYIYLPSEIDRLMAYGIEDVRSIINTLRTREQEQGKIYQLPTGLSVEEIRQHHFNNCKKNETKSS